MTVRYALVLVFLGTTARAAEVEPQAANVDPMSGGPGGLAANTDPDLGGDPDSSEAQLGELSLNDLLNVKVTVATRTPEVVQDAPGSMTVFTREQIQRMGVTTLEDLLNYVPGFQVTSDAVYARLSRITVRGLFSTVSSGVLLLHDGLPEWNAFDGSAWNFGRHVLLNDVERVEVIRGPGSTLWGTNASSAAINIVTVKDRNTASAGYGTIGRRELSANFHSEPTPGLKLSGSVQGYGDDGFTFKNYTDTFGVTGDIKDPLSQYTATVRGEYKGLTLTVHNAGTWWRDYVNWAAASPLNRNMVERYRADLAYRLRLGPRGSVTLGVTYSSDRLDALGVLVPQGVAIIPGQPLARDAHGGPFITTPVVRVRADATWTPIVHNTLSFGFSGAHGWMSRAGHLASSDPATMADFGNTRLLTGEQNFVDENAWETLLGLYAQDTHRLGPLILTAGARMDYTLISAKLPGPFDRQRQWYVPILPRVALTYKTPMASTVKLMYGRAFRAPSTSELTIAHNPVISGGLATNTTLRPELVDTGELAYTQNLWSRASLTATGYVSYADNLITPGQTLIPTDACFPFCTPGSTALGNNSRLLTTGIEVDLQANPVKGLLLVGGYSHLLGAWKNGERVEVEQGDHAFSADLGYSVANLTLDVSGYFRQRVALLPQQSSYLVLNSRVSYRFANRLKVSATAENLLDERPIGLTSYNLPNGAPARGRTFYLLFGYE